ncbi:bile acid:sodium symporter family protein [Endozoicomonas sp. G2_1]|uniref:bile acid:sodium symporter family protein n=1 Tax=Endozoicomonas sp. G2_1 TaxID=2821091 RepID=UPI001ADAF49F|nr:bile acid:sodium symporter [Endozoicomonas sp. G2_1]MBO9490245.1 bile acid:sodium symporter family protein [Endozoicomonas sp. G2_1]
MEALITPALLFAQAVIMFSLGVGLTLADFKRIIDRPYVFAIGICCQVVFVPLCALAIVYLFNFPPVFAAGLMILSFCPGGVTSNIISKLSKADVALSVSLTAIVSVMSFLTVPALVSWAITHFMGEDAIEFSFFDLSIVTFVVTTTPVVLGVVLRHYKSVLAIKLESVLEKIAMVLWVIIVALAVANVFERLVANFAQIGTGILLMPFVLVVFSLITSRLFGLDIRESKTLAVESSIQNSPLAIALAATITGATGFVGELAMPAAVYSITMYLVAIVFILFFRNWNPKSVVATA